jgi:hypothetical protein
MRMFRERSTVEMVEAIGQEFNFKRPFFPFKTPNASYTLLG